MTVAPGVLTASIGEQGPPGDKEEIWDDSLWEEIPKSISLSPIDNHNQSISDDP